MEKLLMTRKKAISLGLVAVAGVLIIGLTLTPKIYRSNIKINKLQDELNKPKIIREYIDVNNNGEFEAYKLIKKYNDGSEEVVPDSDGDVIRYLRFQTPFGGELTEAPRELLNNLFTDYNYPNVDGIRFRY